MLEGRTTSVFSRHPTSASILLHSMLPCTQKYGLYPPRGRVRVTPGYLDEHGMLMIRRCNRKHWVCQEEGR